MNFHFSVSGHELLKHRFTRIAGAMGNMQRFFEPAADEFERIQTDWFSSQGRGKWVPLSPRYAAWKAMNYPGRPLLVLTGDLRDARFEQRKGPTSLQIEIEAPFYWVFHQYGTRKMPARPPYIIDQATINDMRDVFRRAIIEHLSGQ